MILAQMLPRKKICPLLRKSILRVHVAILHEEGFYGSSSSGVECWPCYLPADADQSAPQLRKASPEESA